MNKAILASIVLASTVLLLGCTSSPYGWNSYGGGSYGGGSSPQCTTNAQCGTGYQCSYGQCQATGGGYTGGTTGGTTGTGGLSWCVAGQSYTTSGYDAHIVGVTTYQGQQACQMTVTMNYGGTTQTITYYIGADQSLIGYDMPGGYSGYGY